MADFLTLMLCVDSFLLFSYIGKKWRVCTHMCMYMTVSVCDRGCVCRQVNAGELFFQCHIFGMVVLCPRLLHSW